MVDVRSGAKALGQVTSPVVTLDEHPTGIACGRRLAAVPHVGDKEGDVTGLCHNGLWMMVLPLEVVVSHAVRRRRLPGRVAAWNDRSRAGLERAVHQIEVRSDREDR